MANPVSIVASSVSIFKAIIDLAFNIKKGVYTFKHNEKDCQKMDELVTVVSTVAQDLQKATEEDGGGGIASGDALKALRQALQGGWDLIVSYEKKNAVERALDADGIAEKLRRVNQDISVNLITVVLANVTYNTHKLVDISRTVAALRAEVAKILEIVAPRPDANLRLQQQVARLVQSYSDSTGDDASYCHNESTRETKKTDDVARELLRLKKPRPTMATLGSSKPCQDSSPDRDLVVVINDREQHLSHWYRAAANNKLLVYEFYDRRSSLCKAMDKPLEKLAKQYTGKADFGKLDVDNPEFKFLARLLGLEAGAYPKFWLVKRGEHVGSVVGVKEEGLERSIRRALNST